MRLKRLLLLSTAIVSSSVLAAQKPPAVVSGAVVFSQSGNRLTITESSPSAVLNWQAFSVAKGEIVQFVQPSASASILNRVTGGGASAIDGLVQANGRLFLLNPNGITIGAGGRITAAGLLLTSSAIADADYLAGRYVFTGVPGQGAIANHGSLEGGTVVLSAPQVSNDGTISAHLGRVALGAAAGFTLDTAGDGLWKYQITEPAAAALVTNAGTIGADGGSVLISARSLDRTMRDVINNSGMIEARGVREQNGEIILDGGTVGSVTLGPTSVLDASAGDVLGNGGHISVTGAATRVDGILWARGGAQGGDGGAIETSGESLSLASALVDVSAKHGNPGSWLLDPTDFVIDGTNNSALQTSLTGGNVTIQTTAGAPTVNGSGAGNGSSPGANGDITVSAPISWTSNTTLTLDAYHSVLVNANISASGNTAGLTVKYNDGGTGGNLITGSGKSVTLSGTTPSLTINGSGFTLLSTSAALAAVNVSTNYALAGDINVGAFTPIGYTAVNNDSIPTRYASVFDGLGHSLTNMTINISTSKNIGVFSQLETTATVRNLGVTTATVSGGPSWVGIIAGYNYGTVLNSYSSGTVTGTNQGIGGLVGGINGTILQSYSSATVSATTSGSSGVGGLAGIMNISTASISASYATGNVTAGSAAQWIGGLAGIVTTGATVQASYATGNVTAGAGSSLIGGLVGLQNGTAAVISSSHATGSVSADSSVGGLVGYAQTGSTIINSYATGPVSAGNNTAGGLVGRNNSSTISASYATGNVTGSTSYIGGLAGYNSGAGTILTSYATGSVTANGAGSTCVGGLAGYNGGLIRGSYATGAVSSTYQDTAGLVGYNNGTIANSFATGAVSAASDSTGGLVGVHNAGTITASYATGNVTDATGTIGGLAGYSGGVILNSYAQGNATGGSGVNAGGLVGWANGGTISASYSSGIPTASSGIGGLIGYNNGTVSASYWDMGGSGRGSATGGTGGSASGTATGLTHANATDTTSYASYYASLDFTNSWFLGPSNYPALQASPLVLKISVNAASKTYGNANPALSASSITGNFWSTDTSSLVSLSTTATTGSSAGTYAITASATSTAPNSSGGFL